MSPRCAISWASARRRRVDGRDPANNARELDNQSGMLRSAVDGFLAKVRAA